MLYQLRSNAFDVFIPHAVLGEICGVIFRDFVSGQDKRNKIGGHNGLQRNFVEKHETDRKKNAFGIMMALSSKDKLLDATDIMIVSHVLSDPNSKFFITADSNMIRNAAIMDLDKDLNVNGKRHTTLKTFDRL